MVEVKYGGQKAESFELVDSDDLVVVRTKRRKPVRETRLSGAAQSTLTESETVAEYPAVGVEVIRTPDLEKRAALAKDGEIDYAGRGLCDPDSGASVVYTENTFIKFRDDVSQAKVAKQLGALKHGLKPIRRLNFARNSFFLRAPQGSGRDVFDFALELLERDEVEFCHPELVRPRDFKGAHAQQWHLQKTTIGGMMIDAHVAAKAAWNTTQGEGTVIAVIDDGVDLAHEEFSSRSKLVSPRDATFDRHDANPVFARDNHGTACAGVACADGLHGASGVAPKARLLPIRLMSGLGSIDEAEAFYWAAKFGADVISCSWGPVDGQWWNPNDPLHNQKVKLPDSTRIAIDAATDHGRNGQGCIITWAAGNGNESVDNDGYASYQRVIAVAACNDTGSRSVYSDYGDALWCAFPSNDAQFNSHPAPLTTGIWTTDRSGAHGYNHGSTNLGDSDGDYTNDFGGTSSSCPGVAGVAALMLSKNPTLSWQEVKDAIRQSCDKIDPSNGKYNAQGHSRLYGFGRINAETAVRNV